MSVSLYLQSNISLGLKVKTVYVTKYVLTYNYVIKALASNVSINLHQFQFKLLISTCGQQTYRGIPIKLASYAFEDIHTSFSALLEVPTPGE